MFLRKALFAACVAALTTTPAWAGPARGPPPHDGVEVHGRSGRPHPEHPVRSHRCTPHRVAYVAAGTLVSHTLVLDGPPTPTVSAAADGGDEKPTYSGEVTIAVRRTNRHARADKGTTKAYVLDHARVVLRLDDQDNDGDVDLADAVPGSRAKVIGKVTKLSQRCDQTGFTPELTIRKLLVHPPQAPTS